MSNPPISGKATQGARAGTTGASSPASKGSETPQSLSGLGRFRIKTIDLYVARSFIQAYLICSISFIGLFILVEAFSKLDRFLRQDTPLVITLLEYHLAMVPTVYANYMAPMLTLAAGMFTMTALNRQNELTPLKAAGVSVYRTLLPIFFLAICLTGITFYLKEQVIPYFKEPIRAALALSRSRPLNPTPYYDRKSGFLIRVREYSPTKKIAGGIEISEQHLNHKAKQRIDAARMEWLPEPGQQEGTDSMEEGIWVLHEGSTQHWDKYGNLIVNTSASNFARLKTPFNRMEFQTTLRPVDLESSDLDISYLSLKELRKQYQRQPEHRHLAVKLHHHFAFPLAHLVLLFLGIPFVLNFGSRSLFLSTGMSFAICALFFLTSSLCMNIANHSQILSPVLAAWLPVMLFGALGITLFDRLPT